MRPESHPYMYFSSADVPALREKARSGRGAEAWRNLMAVARRRRHWKPYQPSLVPPVLASGGPAGSSPWRGDYQAVYVEQYRLAMLLRNMAELHAFAYVLGKDPGQLDAALRWALFPCRWDQAAWDAYSLSDVPPSAYTENDLLILESSGGALVGSVETAEGPRARFADTGIFTTFKLRGLAVAYDWLAPALDAPTRELLAGTIAAQCARLYHHAREGHGLFIKHMVNHTWFDVAGFGIAALALYHEHPDAPEWVRFARDQFVERLLPGTLGRDGEFPEPCVYVWEYALMNAGLFFEALRRVTGEDLLAHPSFQKVPGFLLDVLSPCGGMAFDEDMTGFDRGEGMVNSFRPLMLRLASHQRNPRAQWFALGDHLGELGEEKGKLYPGGHWFPEEREYTGHWELLWHDPTVAAESPPQAPSVSHLRDTGYVVMRGGWEPKDAYLCFRSGTFLGPHDRLDQNKLVLYARGERLVEHLYGPNYGYFEYFKNTPGSNTILVDGQGQAGVEQGRHPRFEAEYKSDRTAGKVLRVESGPLADYAVGDATAAYGGRLVRFVRTVIFVKPDLFVLFDDLATPGQPAQFAWLLHSAGEIETAGDEAIVWKPTARLSARALLPAPCRWELKRTPPDNSGRILKRHLELGPVEPLAEARFLVVLAPLDLDEPAPKVGLEEANGRLVVTATSHGRVVQVEIDPSQYRVDVTPGG